MGGLHLSVVGSRKEKRASGLNGGLFMVHSTPYRTAVSTIATNFLFLIFALASAAHVLSQPTARLQSFFSQDVGLNDAEIADIRSGKAVVRIMPQRTPEDVFLFGAIYIHATPERYINFRNDLDRLRNLPGYISLGVFRNPPQPSDLERFTFDSDEISALKNCKPGECPIQMPATSMEELQRSIDWSATGADEQVNKLLQQTALRFLLAYQRDGNAVLGVYNDKRDPTEVSRQFANMLSYWSPLSSNLPDFYNYLLDYPKPRLANARNTFYWARVKFGLKPTLRIVQLTSVLGKPGTEVVCGVAEKQLYSSHYFRTALDLSFCVRDRADPEPGFYLIMAMGSEQAGLTGVKGTIIRKAAVSRSLSNLQDALTRIRATLEAAN